MGLSVLSTRRVNGSDQERSLNESSTVVCIQKPLLSYAVFLKMLKGCKTFDFGCFKFKGKYLNFWEHPYCIWNMQKHFEECYDVSYICEVLYMSKCAHIFEEEIINWAMPHITLYKALKTVLVLLSCETGLADNYNQQVCELSSFCDIWKKHFHFIFIY